MAYIIFSSFLALVALALAVVPVIVILCSERRAGTVPAARAGLVPAQTTPTEWPVAA